MQNRRHDARLSLAVGPCSSASACSPATPLCGLRRPAQAAVESWQGGEEMLRDLLLDLATFVSESSDARGGAAARQPRELDPRYGPAL
jgi:hypothetical protein